MTGVAVHGEARGGAVVDRALVAAGQGADAGGLQRELTFQRNGTILICGEQYNIAQGAPVQTEHTDIAGAVGVDGAGKGGRCDGIAAAVVGVDERLAVRGTDRRLRVHRETGVAVVVDGALLQEDGCLVQQGTVGIVIQAQVMQMTGRADANLRRGAGQGGALDHAADEVGIEEVGDVIHRHLTVEGGGHLTGIDQRIGQAYQPVAAADILSVPKRVSIFYTAQGIGDGDGVRRLGAVDHAVAVVHDGAAGTEGGAVGTQETVGAVAVFFIVGQRAGLEIRLPVAVVGQTGEPGVGVGAQAHVVHEVVGHGVACLRGKGGAQDLYALCAVLAAPFGVIDEAGAGQIVPAGEQVIDSVYVSRVRAGSGGLDGGVGQLHVGAQADAGTVTGLEAVAAGELTAGETGGGAGALEAGGVAVGQGDIGGAVAGAYQAAGDAVIGGGVQVAVRVGMVHSQSSTARIAHQAAGIADALNHGSREAAADGQRAVAAACQTARRAAAEPDVLFGLGAEFVAGGTEIHLTVEDLGLAAETAGQAAGIAGGGDVGAAEAQVFQRAGEGGKKTAVAGGVHGQTVNDWVVDLAVHGGLALAVGQAAVGDGRERAGAVQAVPAVVGVFVDKLDILLLHGAGDAVGQAGGRVQILQVAGVGNNGGVAAANLGKQTVGGQRAGGGVHQTVLTRHLHGDGQVRAGGQIFVFEAGLLAEAHTVRQRVQDHGGGVGEIVGLDLAAGQLDAGGAVDAVGDGHIEVQRLHRRVAGDAQKKLLFVDDLHMGRQLAGDLGLHTVAAVIAHDGAGAQPAITEPQGIEAVKVICQGFFTVKHGVDAAAGGVELDHPMVVPQLAVHLALREDGRGGGVFAGLGGGGHIVQGGFPLGGVQRRVVQGLQILRIAVGNAAIGQQLGQLVLGRVVDDLRLGVQFCLAQVALMAGDGDHGQAHQHDQNGDRDEDFGQRKAGIILF